MSTIMFQVVYHVQHIKQQAYQLAEQKYTAWRAI